MNLLPAVNDTLWRRAFFAENFPLLPGANRRQDISFSLPNTCPACGYLTLSERCAWDICGICFWEDDGQDEAENKEVWGGPNGDYSLADYRRKFTDFLQHLYTVSDNTSASEALAALRQVNATILTFHVANRQELIHQLAHACALVEYGWTKGAFSTILNSILPTPPK